MIWPLVAYFAFVVVLVAAILVISYLLGPKTFRTRDRRALRRRHRFRRLGARAVFGSVTTWSRCSSWFSIWKQSFCLPGPERLAKLGWAGYWASCAVHRNAGRGAHLSLEGRRAGLGAEATLDRGENLDAVVTNQT